MLVRGSMDPSEAAAALRLYHAAAQQAGREAATEVLHAPAALQRICRTARGRQLKVLRCRASGFKAVQRAKEAGAAPSAYQGTAQPAILKAATVPHVAPCCSAGNLWSDRGRLAGRRAL